MSSPARRSRVKALHVHAIRDGDTPTDGNACRCELAADRIADSHEGINHSVRFKTAPTDAESVFLISISGNRKLAIVVFVNCRAGNYSTAIAGYCDSIYLRAAKVLFTKTIIVSQES